MRLPETARLARRALLGGSPEEVKGDEAEWSDDDGWHHYCLVYDGADWSLYVDGAVAHTATASLNTGSENPLTIGVRDNESYLGGSVDELYVYSSALSESEIQTLYVGDTLIAHYSFDDGTAAEDSDGSLDGTITGATATTGQYGIGGALSFDGSDDYVEFPEACFGATIGAGVFIVVEACYRDAACGGRTSRVWDFGRGPGASASLALDGACAASLEIESRDGRG